MNHIGFNAIAKYEHELLNYATQKLMEIDGLQVFGTAKHKTSLISFNLEMIFSSFLSEDLSAMIIGVKTKIAINTPKANNEKINSANDVLIFQINMLILTSLVFCTVNTTININVIIDNIK